MQMYSIHCSKKIWWYACRVKVQVPLHPTALLSPPQRYLLGTDHVLCVYFYFEIECIRGSLSFLTKWESYRKYCFAASCLHYWCGTRGVTVPQPLPSCVTVPWGRNAAIAFILQIRSWLSVRLGHVPKATERVAAADRVSVQCSESRDPT